MTAHVSPSFEARCEKAGASGFLPKPFNISDIEECLQSVFFDRDGSEGDGFESDYDDDTFTSHASGPVEMVQY